MELVPDPANARVQRAFAFVDMCGFTRLADRRGDDVAVRALVDFRARVRGACAHYGVRVATWLGDGAMLVGVDPQPLACGAYEVVGPRPRIAGMRVRAGMAAGPVLLFEGDDYVGRTVNLAARLCDAAAPGEVLVATSDLAELPASLRLRPRAAITVPGFRAPIDVASMALAAPNRSAS